MASFIDQFNTNTKTAMYAVMDDAIWLPQIGGSVAIKVEYSSEYLLDELGNKIDIQQPMAAVFADDVPNIAQGDILDVQGQQLKVNKIQPGGDGMLDLILGKVS